MTGGTMCSGIGAPEQAAPDIKWVWHAEIEPFPCAVMAARHPQSVNLGDITASNFIDRAQSFGTLDVLVAGTPCQAFSVAGLRQSLADARGNLTLRFVDAVHALRPRYAVWENVPGVLSTHDNAFGCLLGGIVGDNAPLVPLRGKWTNAGVVDGPLGAAAWRVLDAQYFGLAQRRKRVFLVFRSGAIGKHPAEVLFEWDRMRRDSPPSREAGQGVAGSIAARTRGGGGLGTDFDCDGGLVPNLAPTLEGRAGRSGANNFATSGGLIPSVSMCLNGGAMNRIDAESETLITAPVWTRPYADNASHESQLIVAHALRGEGFDASENGTGRGTPLVPMCLPILEVGARTGTSTTDIRAGSGTGESGDPMFTLQAGKQHGVLSFHENQRGEISMNETVGSLKVGGGKPGQGYHAVAYNLRGREGGAMPEPTDVASLRSASGGSSRTYVGVRRLMVVECERLQGMADGYTAIKYNGKPAKDGPRYKAIGNSMAVPVLSWILRRFPYGH